MGHTSSRRLGHTRPYTRDDTMVTKRKKADQIFETVDTFALEGGTLAYQRGDRGSHRICLVDKDGKEVASGHPSSYESPIFMTIGAQQFVAFSEYHDGSIETGVLFKLDALVLIGIQIPKSM